MSTPVLNRHYILEKITTLRRNVRDYRMRQESLLFISDQDNQKLTESGLGCGSGANCSVGKKTKNSKDSIGPSSNSTSTASNTTNSMRVYLDEGIILLPYHFPPSTISNSTAKFTLPQWPRALRAVFNTMNVETGFLSACGTLWRFSKRSTPSGLNLITHTNSLCVAISTGEKDERTCYLTSSLKLSHNSDDAASWILLRVPSESFSDNNTSSDGSGNYNNGKAVISNSKTKQTKISNMNDGAIIIVLAKSLVIGKSSKSLPLSSFAPKSGGHGHTHAHSLHRKFENLRKLLISNGISPDDNSMHHIQILQVSQNIKSLTPVERKFDSDIEGFTSASSNNEVHGNISLERVSNFLQIPSRISENQSCFWRVSIESLDYLMSVKEMEELNVIFNF